MKFVPYTIIDKQQELEDTYIIRLAPLYKNIFDFLAGQYCYLLNPTYKDPKDPHPFSIASSPFQRDYLEFCVKTYGEWTTSFVKKSVGKEVLVSDPLGEFTWSRDISYAVFLLGGIGIAPIMSILRTLATSHSSIPLTILYGNRNPGTIAYKKELEELTKHLALNIIHIFSDSDIHSLGNEYQGFITKEILLKEVNFTNKSTFFIVGPPIFVEKMNTILSDMHITKQQQRQELLAVLSVPV